MDDLASDLGCRPNLWALKTLSDPVLTYKLLFGPVASAQYRLEGQNAWEGAEDFIKSLPALGLQKILFSFISESKL